MSKTIEGILEDNYPFAHHSCGIEADPADGSGNCTCKTHDQATKDIEALITEARIEELDNRLLWQAKRLCNAGEARKITKNWFWIRIENRLAQLKMEEVKDE